MTLKEGERYTCQDAACGCQIQVIKGAKPGGGGSQSPRCCCGKEMRLQGAGSERQETGTP